MNKLLRKPWVVAGLVIGMAALWWLQMRSFLYPGMTSDEPVAVLANDTANETLSSENTETAETLSIEPIPGHAIVPTQLRWNSAVVRDPFGPVAVSAVVMTPLPVVAVPIETVSVKLLEAAPTLEAVLNTPSAHIAVIDGRIVRVGDTISGRAVLKIDTASVALGRGPEASEPLLLKLSAP